MVYIQKLILENFKKHKETLDGLIARVVQHEYDHMMGKFITDY